MRLSVLTWKPAARLGLEVSVCNGGKDSRRLAYGTVVYLLRRL